MTRIEKNKSKRKVKVFNILSLFFILLFVFEIIILTRIKISIGINSFNNPILVSMARIMLFLTPLFLSFICVYISSLISNNLRWEYRKIKNKQKELHYKLIFELISKNDTETAFNYYNKKNFLCKKDRYILSGIFLMNNKLKYEDIIYE